MEHTREAAPVTQDETAKAERDAAPSPAAGAVLALQRSIGNRAVGKRRWKASYIFVRPNF